ncbi:DUF1016 N-terminal domain-containing protein [Tissierella sp.]|uniref:DUF1016 N-terminal domain-containing protein n=1 Tax=Tissierella sp. TaxID=41274 RepID=UPI0028A8D723|nr:DUF1016 N-terminal domain-containing protein [Tissierella sp.]
MPKGELNHNYEKFIKDIKQSIKKERLNIVIAVNRKMILLYWMIGDKILVSQSKLGWGAKVINRMSKDLQDDFLGMKGFSARNLQNVGRNIKLCKRLLHKFLGAVTFH